MNRDTATAAPPSETSTLSKQDKADAVFEAMGYRETYGLFDRTKWGHGDWDTEPDQVDWFYKGLKCEVRRQEHMGHLCGYVHAPMEIPSDNADEFRVHGGVTFNEQGCIGFDCAHSGDESPYEPYRYESPTDQYCTVDYVKRQTEQLADQVLAYVKEKQG